MSERAPADMTVIGRDTRIKGEMFFDNGARILGTFEGRISAKGEVQIGESATCDASVEADTIVVDGAVTGDLAARTRLSLSANARVTGDLTAGSLVVVEGATFVGHCTVGPEASKLMEQREARAAAPAPTPRTQAHPGARTSAENRTAARAAAESEIDFKPPWRQNGNQNGNAAAQNGAAKEPALSASANDD